MNNEPLIERMDLVIATLKLAFSREITATRDRLRGDPATAAILDATAEASVRSGVLQEQVERATGLKKRAIRSRLQELTALGAIRQIGSGPTTAYRSTGLI